MKINYLTLGVVLTSITLSGCVSTSKPSPTPEPLTPISQQNLEAQIPQNKSAIRSCILADKSIYSIKDISTYEKGTRLIVENKNGVQKICDVNVNSKATILPITDPISGLNSTFYPVGKSIQKSCVQKEKIMDNDGRLMGTLCK